MPITVKVQAIVPKPFNVGKLRSEIAKVLIEEGKQDRALFNKTVEAWSGIMPAMVYETKINAREASVWIGPKGSEEAVAKWVRLDKGSERHPIAARRASTLVFPYQGQRVSYIPKTKPRSFSSVRAGQKLGQIVRPKVVDHPGIYEPREWSKTLAEQRTEPFAKNVADAIARGLAP